MRENLQYTKRVLIEQQRAHFESEAPIIAPVIRIERQSLESGARKVNEYVLPLDAAWEFPRENLKFGKVSKKQEYNIISHQNIPYRFVSYHAMTIHIIFHINS